MPGRAYKTGNKASQDGWNTTNMRPYMVITRVANSLAGSSMRTRGNFTVDKMREENARVM